MNYKVKDLKNNPIRKELLVNYHNITYELTASDDDLFGEYISLVKDGKIHLLFECEKMTNVFKNGIITEQEKMKRWK